MLVIDHVVHLAAATTVATQNVGSPQQTQVMRLSRLRQRWPVVGKLTEGTSVVVYAGGDFDENQTLRSRLTRQDIEAQMRNSGIRDISHIERVVVEHNGHLDRQTSAR